MTAALTLNWLEIRGDKFDSEIPPPPKKKLIIKYLKLGSTSEIIGISVFLTTKAS